MQSTGVDVIINDPKLLPNKHWALVTNDAAFTIGSIHSRVALLQAGFNITKLFSPEHGISSQGVDGAKQDNSTDPLTTLPVISLYNNDFLPRESDLKDIDGVMFDIPDIGCRFYTYLWTMSYVMEACALYNKPLLLLDRPNPIGTLLENTEGPWLDQSSCSSFIGRWNIPIVHACTLGELALYFKSEKFPELNLEVIKIPDYKRSAASLNQPFNPTSPSMQTLETALLYPGTCLLEGVNINEARGTEFPFTQFGAPWLDAKKLITALNPDCFKNIDCNPVVYKAISGPYENEWCEGIRLKIKDATSIKPVRMGIHLLQEISKLHPDNLTERLYSTYANPSGKGHLDKLLGVQQSFEKIRSGYNFMFDIQEEWENRISKYLLY